MTVVPFRGRAQQQGPCPMPPSAVVAAISQALKQSAELERLVLASGMPEPLKLTTLRLVMEASERLFAANMAAMRQMAHAR